MQTHTQDLAHMTPYRHNDITYAVPNGEHVYTFDVTVRISIDGTDSADAEDDLRTQLSLVECCDINVLSLAHWPMDDKQLRGYEVPIGKHVYLIEAIVRIDAVGNTYDMTATKVRKALSMLECYDVSVSLGHVDALSTTEMDV
jgi:hypothetical protein